MRRPLLVAITSVVLAGAAGGVASAHPLGNFTINHYAGVTVRPESVSVDYVIDMAEIPAFQEISAIDRDGDGVVSQSELAAYSAARCDALRSGLSVQIDARPVTLVVTGTTAALPVGQAGLATLRLECGYSGVLGAADAHPRVLALADTNYAERIGWREITARGQGVALDTTLPTASSSARLTAYPQDLLTSPLDVRRALIRVTNAGTLTDQAPPAEPAAAPATDGRPTDPLASLINQGQPSLFGTAAALVLAFGLGILHALTPGHGKTVMAAYLVGTRGTRAQALVLGPVVALSHTAGVLLLGAITLSASRLIAPERLYPYLSTASGAIVLGIGVTLLARRIRGSHGHDHAHSHSHEPPATAAAFGWRPLAALGLSGGLVPSASALLLLLGAIQFDRIGLGMVLILAFGFGMAATLVTIGLALVGARRVAQDVAGRYRSVGRVVRLMPELGAVVVVLFGVAMTAQGLTTIF
jgi:nickel/cobalt transporter (NicO) family protein